MLYVACFVSMLLGFFAFVIAMFLILAQSTIHIKLVLTMMSVGGILSVGGLFMLLIIVLRAFDECMETINKQSASEFFRID